jgi:hypothetical protein
MQRDLSGTLGHAAYQRFKPKLMIGMGVMLILLALYAWIVDFVTLEGEYTIYTADCAEGAWVGHLCSGLLRPGDRFRFRATRAHREVRFWTAGAPEAAGVLSNCEISSGRSWSCPADAHTDQTITLQMVQGRPVADAQHQTRPFHSISKLRWLLLRAGIGRGNEANE